MVREGQARKLRRGAYLRTGGPAQESDEALGHLVAAHHLVQVEHCFSHSSAALLHGLTLLRRARRPSIYQQSAPTTSAGAPLVRHTPLPSVRDRTAVLGLPVTSLERTAWDLMTSLPAPDAMVVADAALHAGVSAVALAARARPGGRGHRRAMAVLRYADDGPESAPESICRYRLLRAGFPVPDTQIEVVTRLGTYAADLGWERWRLLIEYDGATKYESRGTHVLIGEKRRHDALVEAGWSVIRVTKEDLRTPGAFEPRVRSALPGEATASMTARRELVW